MTFIGRKFGQYKVISRLGAGGMGEVFLAEDTTLGRKAALKFLSADLAGDADHRGRFLREARAASALGHPNICVVYQIELDTNEPFIAMEYAAGETLARMIGRRRRSSLQTVEFALQAADALSQAHARGIVHRDIKPANMIVSDDGKLKILDFGLAKIIDPVSIRSESDIDTAAGIVLGTASYMSPEQARGLELDGRTDIWSLGVCLYESLSGEQPFAAETTTDTLANILTLNPPPLTERFSDVVPELERIVMRCIAKQPLERYQTASELAADLQVLHRRLTAEMTEPDKDRSTGETASFATATTEFADTLRGRDLLERSARPTNLPLDLPKMIGRERETAELVRLLADASTRLVTLTGIGGTGKTRLSLAVGEAALLDFTDGVFFVELSTITDPQLVPAAIAQQLGIRDEGRIPVIETLKKFLAEKHLLLVIDNFEQVTPAAMYISELLAAAPRSKIVVTSRFLLRLSCEVEYGVPPLAMPHHILPEDIRGNEAVQLFAQRAAVAKPSFALNESNAAVIAEICSRLDGLPLAIELAAARIRVLSPQSILSKLADRFALLSGGSFDMPARQQTMRGAIEWSYQLLSAEEQAFFRSLGVFSGGFRLESAEALAAGRSATPVFELIASLIDKSFLLSRNLDDDENRFYTLEVVRDFALEELAAAGEWDELHRRHAEHFTEFAEHAEPFVQAAQSAEWLERLAEEHANLAAAMRWSLDSSGSLALRLAASLRNYWLLHGHLDEGFQWLKAARDLDGDHGLKVKMLSGLGLAARFKGEFETARKAYSKGLEIGVAADDKKGIAVATRGLGLVSFQQNELPAAKEHFRRGLELSRQLADKFGIAVSLSFLGDVYRTESRFDDAIPIFREAVDLFREIDNKTALADALNNLAAAELSVGDRDNAELNFREALCVADELGNKITTSCSLDGFAALAAAAGQSERAAYISRAAAHLRDSIGYQIEPAERAFRDAYLTVLKGKMTEQSLELACSSGANAAAVTAVIDSLLPTRRRT